MSRTIAILFAAALVVAEATAPAAAQDRQYVGTTNALFDGAQALFPPMMLVGRSSMRSGVRAR